MSSRLFPTDYHCTTRGDKYVSITILHRSIHHEENTPRTLNAPSSNLNQYIPCRYPPLMLQTGYRPYKSPNLRCNMKCGRGSSPDIPARCTDVPSIPKGTCVDQPECYN